MGRRSFFSDGELSPPERAKMRELLARVERGELLEDEFDAREVAKMVGLKPRAVLDLARTGVAFPHAYKPAHNRVRIPARDVLAFKLSRRVAVAKGAEA